MTVRAAGMSVGRTKLVGTPPSPRRPGFFDVPSGDPFMQLAGLIPAALRDRGLARARDLARKGFVDSDSLDLTAPASLRPFVVAAVAGAGRAGGAGRPVLAVTATSREADDLADALGCLIEPRPGRRLPVLGDAAARAAVAALRHRRPPARRAAPPGPPRRRPLQVVVAPVRVAAAAAAQGPRRPGAGGAGHRRRGRARGRSPGGCPTWRTPGSTWSPSAASSRSAAASWTSSRPPTSTRPGSSSGATRWRRSAPSRSPTSAPSSRSSGCGRRPAGSCCSRRRSGPGPPSSPPSTPRSPRSSTSWPRASRSRAWSRWPRRCCTAPTAWSC